MTNTENSSQPDTLLAALEALANKYDVTIAEVIWAASDAIDDMNTDNADLAREARDMLCAQLDYMSDSVIEDLLADYCPETQDDEDEDDE